MDEFVKNILKTWGMDPLIETFANQQIDEIEFNRLEEKDIVELIPILGTRKKFLAKYNNYITPSTTIQLNDLPMPIDFTIDDLIKISPGPASNTGSESASTATNTSDCDTYNNALYEEYKINHQYRQNATLGLPYNDNSASSCSSVSRLITTTNEGQIIKASYQKDKHFLRSKLCELIIKNELKDNRDKRISTSRFIQLATEINEIFPHEHPEVYYVPYVNNKNGKPKAARGKLWSSYIYLRSNYKKLGLIPSLSTEDNNSSDANVSEVDDTIANAADEEYIQWLKNNSNPITKVQEYWNLTTFSRKKFLGSIDEYMKTFPALNLQLGYLLFEQDFAKIYKNKESIFYCEWQKTYSAILQIANKKKDSYLKEILLKHNLREHEDDVNQLFALSILPLLFSPVNLKSKKPGIRWKPSKSEIKDGFLLHLNNINELEGALELRNNRYLKFGFTNQPIPVIIGEIDDIKESYVIINSVRYKTDTPIKAVDLCFKIFNVLNAQYPAECEVVWNFIQKGIYKIDTKSDKKYVCVSTIISDIEQILAAN